jgi:RNA polymerase sigma-70 factor (ECF subfamily)
MPEMTKAEPWGEADRRRLVRLCAAVTGDREAAEDLAQETLLEAWRNAHKLRDPAGRDRWLAAIARNVCRRWARRRGQEPGSLASQAIESADSRSVDVEAELERTELADLLDRALGYLPPDTREVLIHRYVHDSPHAEIGARLGLSEDAVSMRISRGKALLRRLLASQLRDDASPYGFLDASDAGWQQTRVWCPECGRGKLLVRREAPPGVASFRCPACDPDSSAPSSEYRLDNPFFAELVGSLVRPTAILARAADWSSGYFAPGAGGKGGACTRCGRPVDIRRYRRDDLPVDRMCRRGLYAECEACGEQVSSSVAGLALSLPEVRGFRRHHPRTRALPGKPVGYQGMRAILLRYEDFLGSSGVDVVFARDSLRVLAVHGATG